MDYPLLDFTLKAANLGVSVGVGLYVWLSNRNRVTHARITELQEKTSKNIAELKYDFNRDLTRLEDEVDLRLDGNGAQLARLEEAGKHAITKDDLGLIYERVNEVAASLSQLKGEFSGYNHTLKLIHEHMLKGGK